MDLHEPRPGANPSFQNRTIRHHIPILLRVTVLAALLGNPLSLPAQDRHTIPADPNLKYSSAIASGVAVPDKIDSSIGTLELNYGYPTAETVEKIYDNLDRSRALQAYLLALPIVNQAGMRDSIGQYGPVNQTDVNWGSLVDPRTVELTANDNTIYNFILVDTKQHTKGGRGTEFRVNSPAGFAESEK